MVAALYHAHYGSLARIAALLTGDNLAAEEIVQDTFASVYRAWRRLRDREKPWTTCAGPWSAGHAPMPRPRQARASPPEPSGHRPPGR